VKKAGVYEAPMGISFKALLDEYCGGMRQGSTLKAIIPGGASWPSWTAAEARLGERFRHAQGEKTHGGLGGGRLPRSVGQHGAGARELDALLRHEICGQCILPRKGRPGFRVSMDKIVAGKARRQDVDNVHQIARQMEMKTICALATGRPCRRRATSEKFRVRFRRAGAS